jgi:tetratricopeptide (TPR) repeat protein
MTEKELKNQLQIILNEIKSGSASGEAYNDAGVAYYLLGEFGKSEFYLKKALEISRKSSWLFNLANTYSALNRPHMAIDTYLQVLENNPSHIGSLNNLADEYEKTGEADKAHELFHYLSHIQPDEALSHFNLGNFFLRQNQHIEAAKCYEAAIKKDPEFTDAYFNIAWILYESKAYKEAEEYINKGLDTDAEHPESLELREKLKGL